MTNITTKKYVINLVSASGLDLKYWIIIIIINYYYYFLLLFFLN